MLSCCMGVGSARHSCLNDELARQEDCQMKRNTLRDLQPAPLLDLMNAPASGIERLHSLLSWKLLAGWHKFPGPDGGTCLVEAAIVVAGLPYRRVQKIRDIPSDNISWVLAYFLLQIKDAVAGEPAPRPVPFLPELAGRAAGPAEGQRIEYLLAATPEQLGLRAALAPDAHPIERVKWAADAVVAAWSGRKATEEALTILERAIKIADEALKIGKDAEPVNPLMALVRLESARPQPPRQAKATAQ